MALHDDFKVWKTRIRWGQQWSWEKAVFALSVAYQTDIPFRVVIAWVGVESSGSGRAPGGAEFNFLQIKGSGEKGSTSSGFARYDEVSEAAIAAAERIKLEPGINNVRGKSDDEIMQAIAITWNDGPGVSRANFPNSETAYLNRMRVFYKRAKQQAVDREWDAILAHRDYLLGNAPAAVKQLDVTSRVADKVGDFTTTWVKELAQVLLTTAGATLGLALIGFGIKSLATSNNADEHARQAVPIAAATVKAAT